MLLETLGGTVLGGLFRLVPEVLALVKGRGERDHEYRMTVLGYEAARAQADGRLAEARLGIEGREIDALVSATTAQGVLTGIAVVDALSATVRPVVTYWWMALYTAYKVAALHTVMQAHQGDTAAALLRIWGAEDMAVLSSILSFWFVDRALRRR